MLDKVTVIRYVRPYADAYKKHFSNLGGATFVFNLDYTARTVEVKFAVCSSTDNFSKQLGIETARNSSLARGFDLDRFQKFADAEGGFVDAFIAIVAADAVTGDLRDDEKNLLRKMKEQKLVRE